MTTHAALRTTAGAAEPRPAVPTPREPVGMLVRRLIPMIIGLAVMIAGSGPLVLLFLWMFLGSFGVDFSAALIPHHLTLEHWKFFSGPLDLEGYTYPSVWTILRNSLELAGSITVLETIIAVAAAYAISRLDLPGRQPLLYTAILSHAFPPIVGLLASFYILHSLGLLGTLAGVVLLKLLGNIPMSVWMMKGFFDKVPREIEWAGAIDGAPRIAILRSIVVPTVRPGIVAIAIFAFLSGWGEYVMISVFIFEDGPLTFPVVLRSLFGDTATESYGTIMALATFYMLPVLLFYIFAQRSLQRLVF